ncbi:glycosyltransferase family 2 protein [Ammoniphilus resinae]|uniref:Glycosyltransferase involved in cell wall biosynthesis n=1 Tax=Ammoniphilus resinae TaxID=861532 RepID=A0ABS4GJR6_9BACL|nr:glycosyltransferase family 2 protein [Ammoniphilus resinae]MBP1930160.1 glycosyltransferase involved in cell wall biosynthesis [Ammoniphilus resinae]
MKNKRALVTVVIPTYNRARFLPRAIKSILKQKSKRWKLLIIDDGSKDKTRKVVRRFQKKSSKIRYVRFKKNHGVSYALRKALSMVDTKYFAQLDADDWYEKNTIRECLKAMRKSSGRVAMVYGNEKVWKMKKGKPRYQKTKKKKQFKGKYDFITYHPMIYPRFYRKSALVSVGGWSTKVPYKGRFAEDRQILLKLAGRYKFKWINKPLYNRLRHSKNNSRTANNKKYAKVTRHLYKSALKRWGNKYKPVFKRVNGRLKVGRLKKRKKRR